MTEHEFLTIGYLRTGSPLQQKGFKALSESTLFDLLKEYFPVLTGTLPLDIFIEGSGLDICCEVHNHKKFESDLKHYFSDRPNFSIHRKKLSDIESTLCTFLLADFFVEIVGQPIAVTRQMAFLHMIIEHKILETKDAHFKEKVIELKKNGIKTEPAFALLLGLPGDPFKSLLTFMV